MATVKAHRVKCQFCNAHSLVMVNAEICPKCCQYGYLEWATGAEEKILEVDETQVEVAAEEVDMLQE